MVALEPHELTAERRLRCDGAALGGVGARGLRLAFSRHLRERVAPSDDVPTQTQTREQAREQEQEQAREQEQEQEQGAP